MPSDGNGNGTSAKHALTFDDQTVDDLTVLLEELSENEIYEMLVDINDQRRRWVLLSQISSHKYTKESA